MFGRPPSDRYPLFDGASNPTSTAGVLDSNLIDTDGCAANWLTLLVPNAGGAGNWVGTIDFLHGAHRDAARMSQLYLSTSDIYVDGLKLSDGAITGLTHGGASNPGRISVAADLAGSVRLRIPLINQQRFCMVRITRTSGGGAAEFWEGVWDGRLSS